MVDKVLSKLRIVYTILIFIFLYAPIIVLIVFSFNDSKSRASWDGFTLKWYVSLFKDRHIMKALYYTLTIAILSSIIATIVGTFAALGIHNMKPIKKKIILGINNVPVVNPDLITGISLMALFIFLKIPLGFVTMLIAHVTFNIPYVILAVLPKLRQIPKEIMEAALDLGATPMYAIRKVLIPQIMPGIVTGLLMAFTLSIDDFVISFFTTGHGVTNLSITIYSMARRGIKPEINALSTLLFLSVLILLLIINFRSSKDEKRREVL
ncbi:ABC transporter permease [Abyssisolibacter fermentans]|uniref:ABC transporter permease n=1 Tax=Abyssisolibacter fermentans TaxID=1766203 RepID=UPI0008326FDA|nr:ABC transporter permease [Abyssisolibacter fermentans]